MFKVQIADACRTGQLHRGLHVGKGMDAAQHVQQMRLTGLHSHGQTVDARGLGCLQPCRCQRAGIAFAGKFRVRFQGKKGEYALQQPGQFLGRQQRGRAAPQKGGLHGLCAQRVVR